VFRRSRTYTKWSKHQTDVVVRYFTEWIETDRPGLPRKKDILPFLDRHGDVMDFKWTVIRNKVLNEKAAFDQRRKAALKKRRKSVLDDDDDLLSAAASGQVPERNIEVDDRAVCDEVDRSIQPADGAVPVPDSVVDVREAEVCADDANMLSSGTDGSLADSVYVTCGTSENVDGDAAGRSIRKTTQLTDRQDTELFASESSSALHPSVTSSDKESGSNIVLLEAVSTGTEPAVDANMYVESTSLPAGSISMTTTKTADNSKPPKSYQLRRPCPFYGKFEARLTRHMKAKHRNEEVVKNCLTRGLKEQRAVFTQLKRNGIMKHNMRTVGQKDAVILRERTSAGRTVVCERCSAVMSRKYMYRHRRICCKERSFADSSDAAAATSVLPTPDCVGTSCQQDIDSVSSARDTSCQQDIDSVIIARDTSCQQDIDSVGSARDTSCQQDIDSVGSARDTQDVHSAHDTSCHHDSDSQLHPTPAEG